MWLQIMSQQKPDYKVTSVEEDTGTTTYFNVRLFKDCEMILVLCCVEGCMATYLMQFHAKVEVDRH